jgi:hypothetical protein
MELEKFNPTISIVAADQTDVIVTFDFASSNDTARSPKMLRVPRKFKELWVEVTEFTSPETGESGDRKQYCGQIQLVVQPEQGDKASHVLATPVLWLEAAGRNKKKGEKPFIFHAPSVVTSAVKTGVSNALIRALLAFNLTEGQIDKAQRAPQQAAFYPAATAPASAVDDSQRTWGSAVSNLILPASAANDGVAASPGFRKKVIVAAIAAPVLVFLVLSVGGAILKRQDPVHEAVARAMAQDPKSTQAQVELTKETLRQMGLDPGKSADVGCLAPQ